MATNILKQKHFHNEQAAFAVLEDIMWPNGPVCPHCGAIDRLGRLQNQRTKASKTHPDRPSSISQTKSGAVRETALAPVNLV